MINYNNRLNNFEKSETETEKRKKKDTISLGRGKGLRKGAQKLQLQGDTT